MADQDFQTVGKELPPRTRRILVGAIRTGVTNGTTSAYAENTPIRNILIRVKRNYLRVRGEYASHGSLFGVYWELPPRTRRIPSNRCMNKMRRGTTSAYAENTPDISPPQAWSRNYLRVRGEYEKLLKHQSDTWELPPRTRRIPVTACSDPMTCGTTSAYAENTRLGQEFIDATRNYLRVRGEYGCRIGLLPPPWELPPRTRRIPIPGE